MDAHRRRAWTKSQQISIGGAHRRASSLRRETLASQLAAKREAIMAIKISKHTKPVRISEVLEKIEARRRHTERSLRSMRRPLSLDLGATNRLLRSNQRLLSGDTYHNQEEQCGWG